MRRTLMLALAALMLATGCTSADGARETAAAPAAEPVPVPVVEETAYSDDSLCWEANAAIRRIILELMQAPNTEAALVEQTVASYRTYAARLRELAGLAAPEVDARAIIDAADAAEEYAQAVHDQNSYHVDIDGVIQASRDAFPTCDLQD
jgi:hypothetical protein